MGWVNMPDVVTESAFDRLIKEGKAYQVSEEFTIPSETSVWAYLRTHPTKSVLLNSRNISATAGPVKYRVYPGATMIGPLGSPINIEYLNNEVIIPSQTSINNIDAVNVDITGIPPSDKKLVVATVNAGNRGSGGSTFQNFFKIYPPDTGVAISIENLSTIESIVELQYIWAEEVK